MMNANRRSSTAATWTRQVRVVRDGPSGPVLELRVINPGQPLRSIDIDQLRIRCEGLQRIIQRSAGLRLSIEDGTEIWAIGERGHRIAVTIPLLEHFIASDDPEAGVIFLRTLEACEQKIMDWLSSQSPALIHPARQNAG